ncbi:MAG: hypothetical protein GNW80_17305, partial [Asgard group archaeon]|nr:hypothetical protein [Asgard group archaeon]
VAGERIFNLKRIISCKLGITREDDRLPKHVLKVMNSGKTEGLKLDLEDNLKAYYKHRDWDWKTGQPTEAKLKELGIIGKGEDVVTDVKPKIKSKITTMGRSIPILGFHNTLGKQ